MSEVAAQGYIYENGVQVIDRDWVEKKTDIQAYTLIYNFPEDMAELLYLNIDVPGIEFYIEGRTFVLKQKPTQWVNNAVTIHYRRKHD
jgi:hypothetical protein